jgi:hypothetical protein
MEKEKITITTNPVLEEIFKICWQDAGGTEEMDNLVIERSYEEFILEAVQKSPIVQWLCAGSVLTSHQIIELWRDMRDLGLAVSERPVKGKREWRKILKNPKLFAWQISQKAGYQWLRPRSVPKPKKEEVPVMPPVAGEQLSSEADEFLDEFLKDKLASAQLDIKELEVKKVQAEQEINRLKQLISPLEKIVALYERLISLEQEKISLLQPA